MNNNFLSFSIIVPYYNSSAYIEKNLSSVINQNYNKKLIQIIVVDDGSSEDASSIIKKVESKYNFKIDFYKKSNGNWGSVINYVVQNKLIKNDLVMVLDSDDCLKQNCFDYVNKNIKDSSIYAISYKKWDGNKKESFTICPFWQLSSNVDPKRKKSPFCTPLAFFYKKDLFYELKPLKENMFYQDNILFAQLVNKSNKIRFTKKAFSLYFFKRQGNSISLEWDEKRLNQELDTCNSLVELNWEEVAIYKLSVKKFRQACDKYNKKLEIRREVEFTFFPWFLRPFFKLFYLTTLKKYVTIIS